MPRHHYLHAFSSSTSSEISQSPHSPTTIRRKTKNSTHSWRTLKNTSKIEASGVLSKTNYSDKLSIRFTKRQSSHRMNWNKSKSRHRFVWLRRPSASFPRSQEIGSSGWGQVWDSSRHQINCSLRLARLAILWRHLWRYKPAKVMPKTAPPRFQWVAYLTLKRSTRDRSII